MDRTEFLQWFERQVQMRWPKWPVNDVTLSDWHAALARFDPARLTEAVRDHLIRDEPSHPSLRRIMAIAANIRLRRGRPMPMPEMPLDLYTLRELAENIPEFFDPQQRERLMLSFARFHADPRSKDPETYDRLAGEGRVPKPILRQDTDEDSATSLVNCVRSWL